MNWGRRARMASKKCKFQFFSRVKTIWGMEQIAEDKGSGEGQSDNICACGKESPGGKKTANNTTAVE